MCGTALVDETLAHGIHAMTLVYIWATGVRVSECYSWQLQRWETQ